MYRTRDRREKGWSAQQLPPSPPLRCRSIRSRPHCKPHPSCDYRQCTYKTKRTFVPHICDRLQSSPTLVGHPLSFSNFPLRTPLPLISKYIFFGLWSWPCALAEPSICTKFHCIVRNIFQSLTLTLTWKNPATPTAVVSSIYPLRFLPFLSSTLW